MAGNSIPATANCTNLSRDQFLGLATARGVSAGVCLSLTVVILFIVIFVRAFESVLQRLFVCLTTNDHSLVLGDETDGARAYLAGIESVLCCHGVS